MMRHNKSESKNTCNDFVGATADECHSCVCTLLHHFSSNQLSFTACGTSAKVAISNLLFAEFPQTWQQLFSYLRNFRKNSNISFLIMRSFRKPENICCYICGVSAKETTMISHFAELPQTLQQTFLKLRKLRKRYTI